MVAALNSVRAFFREQNPAYSKTDLELWGTVMNRAPSFLWHWIWRWKGLRTTDSGQFILI